MSNALELFREWQQMQERKSVKDYTNDELKSRADDLDERIAILEDELEQVEKEMQERGM